MPNYGTTTSGVPLQPQRPGLGRQYAPDPRDRNYLMTSARLAKLQKIAPVKPRTRPWHLGPEVLDQGDTSECVIHAYLHFMQAAPRVHSLGWTRAQRTQRYDLARRSDGFPMPHDGTTARAACEVARQAGEISEYLWAGDEDMARQYLRDRGCLMGGSDWMSTMYTVDKHGYLELGGNVDGGHEVIWHWYYPKTHRLYPDTYEGENSWYEGGKPWGFEQRGIMRLKAADWRYLYFQANGDLVSPIEAPVVRPDIHAPAAKAA
jgi:hypothetical protein